MSLNPCELYFFVVNRIVPRCNERLTGALINIILRTFQRIPRILFAEGVTEEHVGQQVGDRSTWTNRRDVIDLAVTRLPAVPKQDSVPV